MSAPYWCFPHYKGYGTGNKSHISKVHLRFMNATSKSSVKAQKEALNVPLGDKPCKITGYLKDFHRNIKPTKTWTQPIGEVWGEFEIPDRSRMGDHWRSWAQYQCNTKGQRRYTSSAWTSSGRRVQNPAVMKHIKANWQPYGQPSVPSGHDGEKGPTNTFYNEGPGGAFGEIWVDDATCPNLNLKPIDSSWKLDGDCAKDAHWLRMDYEFNDSWGGDDEKKHIDELCSMVKKDLPLSAIADSLICSRDGTKFIAKYRSDKPCPVKKDKITKPEKPKKPEKDPETVIVDDDDDDVTIENETQENVDMVNESNTDTKDTETKEDEIPKYSWGGLQVKRKYEDKTKNGKTEKMDHVTVVAPFLIQDNIQRTKDEKIKACLDFPADYQFKSHSDLLDFAIYTRKPETCTEDTNGNINATWTDEVKVIDEDGSSGFSFNSSYIGPSILLVCIIVAFFMLK